MLSSTPSASTPVPVRYGRGEVDVALPPCCDVQVLRMSAAQPLRDPESCVRHALASPLGAEPLRDVALRAVSRGRASACLVVCDATRPVPNEMLLRPALQVFEASGVPRANILILVATGLHRGSTHEERIEMLGLDIAQSYNVQDHDARDEAGHQAVGGADGVWVPVLGRSVRACIDRRYMEAGVKVVLGLAEPHFMAGYSGGRKMVCPGIASASTIFSFHSAPMIAHAESRSGNLQGNPIHQMALGVARAAGVDFSLMVTLSESRQVTGLWAGGLEETHAEAVKAVDASSKVRVRQSDVVLTSAAGHPLDATFYQTIKAMCGALPAVKQGGAIVVLSSMSGGVGSGEFEAQCQKFHSGARWHEELLRAPVQIDQWQLQKLWHALNRARCLLVSDSTLVQPEMLRSMGIEPWSHVQEALSSVLGPQSSLCVIPEGPYVLPASG